MILYEYCRLLGRNPGGTRGGGTVFVREIFAVLIFHRTSLHVPLSHSDDSSRSTSKHLSSLSASWSNIPCLDVKVDRLHVEIAVIRLGKDF
jgi:hypothetical protein